ncbi:uncharacterized protein [Epargyreus clarus]|uniref:uncharacterized protein n=1 Tax=Epargyreus clarus TaxID=520877 RepID=UPI003C2EE507
MMENVEGGAGIAWRLLATLEGGSLLLATSALLAYTARTRITKKRRHRNIQRVLITNTSNPLGKELQTKLEARSCIVSSLTSDTTSEAGGMSDATSGADSDIDVLVVIGSEPVQHNLNHIAQLVSEDVYNNLRLMESLSARLRRGGCIAWACAGATSGAYRDAIAAFDTVLKANLIHVAKTSECEAIWIGRCQTTEQAVNRTLAELMPSSELQLTNEYSFRNVANKVSEYLGRWLKIIT